MATASTDNATTSEAFCIIVGAGIAGLATAIAMRAEGRRVIVLEQSRLKSEVGAAIHLAPNATKICHKWGLDIKKAARATVCREFSEVGGDGKIHVRVPLDTEKAFGAPWLFQHRVDLHTALREYAEADNGRGPPAEIITSAKVVDIDTENGIVKTEDGKTFQGKVIVGADGIHSAVRSSILGRDNVAQPSGHSAYRCLIPKERIEDIEEAMYCLKPNYSNMQIVVEGNRRVVIYPCRDSTILNIVAICPDSQMKEESVESWKAVGSADELVSTFKGFPEWLIKVLSRAENPGLWQLRDQEPLSTWVKGRCIVVGDAAHSMLPHQGQGAGQSIEDAEALGALFENVSSDASLSEVNSTLENVFKARIERASLIQAYSRQQAKPVEGSEGVRLNANQFAGYNMSYGGIKDWIAKQNIPIKV